MIKSDTYNKAREYYSLQEAKEILEKNNSSLLFRVEISQFMNLIGYKWKNRKVVIDKRNLDLFISENKLPF
jgi:hypothetical protein